MVEGDLLRHKQLSEATFTNNFPAKLAMSLHDGALIRSKAPGLLEDRLRNANLANVVQAGAKIDQLAQLLVQTHFAGELACHCTDPIAMLPRLVVVEFDCDAVALQNLCELAKILHRETLEP